MFRSIPLLFMVLLSLNGCALFFGIRESKRLEVTLDKEYPIEDLFNCAVTSIDHLNQSYSERTIKRGLDRWADNVTRQNNSRGIIEFGQFSADKNQSYGVREFATRIKYIKKYEKGVLKFHIKVADFYYNRGNIDLDGAINQLKNEITSCLAIENIEL